MYYSPDGAKVYLNLSLADVKEKGTEGVFITRLDDTYVHLPSLGEVYTEIDVSEIPAYAKVVPKCSNTEIPTLVHIPESIENDIVSLAAMSMCRDVLPHGAFERERRDYYSILSRVQSATRMHFLTLAEAASLSLGVLFFFATGEEGWYENDGGKWTLDKLNLESEMMRHLLKSQIVMPVHGAAVIWNPTSKEAIIELIVHKMGVMQPRHLQALTEGVREKRHKFTDYERAIATSVEGEVKKIKERLPATRIADDAYNARSFKVPACMRKLSKLPWHTRLVLANHVLWIRTMDVDTLLNPNVFLEKIFTRHQLKHMSKSVRDFLAMVKRDKQKGVKPKCVGCRTIQTGAHQTLSCPFQSTTECATAEGKELPDHLVYNITPIGMAFLKARE